jgi:hypothetical protein
LTSSVGAPDECYPGTGKEEIDLQLLVASFRPVGGVLAGPQSIARMRERNRRFGQSAVGQSGRSELFQNGEQLATYVVLDEGSELAPQIRQACVLVATQLLAYCSI